jgi:hypothetical protein
MRKAGELVEPPVIDAKLSFTIAQSRRALLFQQVTWKSPIFFERDLLNT